MIGNSAVAEKINSQPMLLCANRQLLRCNVGSQCEHPITGSLEGPTPNADTI
jgi:hypothetical protein